MAGTSMQSYCGDRKTARAPVNRGSLYPRFAARAKQVFFGREVATSRRVNPGIERVCAATIISYTNILGVIRITYRIAQEKAWAIEIARDYPSATIMFGCD